MISNGVVVSAGMGSFIRRSVFVSIWLSDTQRISVTELVEPDNELVTVDHDQPHPPPKRTADSRSSSSPSCVGPRSMSPPPSPDIMTLSVDDYHPTAPPPSQPELPEAERPPSRRPADTSPHPAKPHTSTRLNPAGPPNVTMAAPPMLRPPPPVPHDTTSFPMRDS